LNCDANIGYHHLASFTLVHLVFVVVMIEIGSFNPSMSISILADRFQNNIEVSNNICIMKSV